VRLALGVSYRGQSYQGWQSQPDGKTVQDQLEFALSNFAGCSVRVVCAGRTDSGVHALNQVVHFDTHLDRALVSWVRGTNSFLPHDIAVQWCQHTTEEFHARFSALGRKYVYVLLESVVRPTVEAGSVGWSMRKLDTLAMQSAALVLVGEHDYSAFRAAECQASSPVKTIRSIAIKRHGAYWRFEFDANAFLHRMVRNVMGCLLAVGSGAKNAGWMEKVLESKDRRLAAATFCADGLYFVGPYYDPIYGIPDEPVALDWLPGGRAF
jgi:tRNA pseudouridine38-40 synthase